MLEGKAMFLRKCNRFAIMLMVGLLLSPTLCLGDDNVESREASSMLEAILLNAHSVRAYDVLIRHESIREPGPTESSEQTIYIRVRADWDEERLLFALSSRTTTTLDGDCKVIEHRAGGGLAHDDAAFELRKNGLARYQSTFRSLLNRFDIPDIRLVGLSKFPAMVGSVNDGVFEGWTQIASAERTLALNSHAGVTTVTRNIPVQGMLQTTRSILTLTFPAASMMPAQVVHRLRAVPERGAPETAIFFREKYEWEERDGVSIPTLIVGEYRDSTMRENEEDGKAKLRYFEAERTTHFHWFSVNEEMRDAEFDSALIEGQGLQRLVDPTLSRATSLQGL